MLTKSIARLSAPLIAATLSFATPAFADGMGLMIDDPYARAATSTAKSGAAFMSIMNHSDTDDQLIAASTDIATRVELHTHTEDENGVMRMREVEGGIPIPAGETTMLERGGLHVMLMGLTEGLDQGDEIEVTLTFQNAGDMVLTIPVDNDRKAAHGGHGGHGSHGSHDHGSMDHSATDGDMKDDDHAGHNH
ncbi:MAG: copper chaperone PCu(A)C [Pseudomonadota bacterium]